MPEAWVRERKRDYYYRKAKEDKYRSRATYKLFQAVKKYHFIKEGDIVVDLGAAPGGWTQGAREIVGDKGFVLGLDINPLNPFSESNIQTIVGDMRIPETLQKITGLLPEEADVVISDAAPNVSGVWEVDHARQIELAEHALEIALKILKPSGSLFVKTFQGDMLEAFIERMRQHFNTVKIIKPKASRAKSSELFILGLNRK
ncbi:MAG: RlmE family RNA methyltransferase [Candidatus Bathyarchaeota archaeon]